MNVTELHKPKKVLLTGAGGFIGSHVLEHLLVNTNYELYCPVTFTHKGNSDRISEILDTYPNEAHRVHVFRWDLTTPLSHTTAMRIGRPDYVLNVASESHVDRSITDPASFIENNVRLILNVLEACRDWAPEKILHMSTDEVFGPAHGEHLHSEWEAYKPSNPYAASKAAQESIAYSYWRTYDLPIIVTNTMNLIGERQDPEKFVMKTLRSALRQEPMTIHVAPDGTPGSRFYLHARNLADAWLYLLNGAEFNTYTDNLHSGAKCADGSIAPYGKYNIVGEREVNNLEMAQLICKLANVPEPEFDMVDFHSSRPGHDTRYGLSGELMKEIGWEAPLGFEESLSRTIQWTLNRADWIL